MSLADGPDDLNVVFRTTLGVAHLLKGAKETPHVPRSLLFSSNCSSHTITAGLFSIHIPLESVSPFQILSTISFWLFQPFSHAFTYVVGG